MPRKSRNADMNALEGTIELHVASRMRLRRGLLGMSQSDVAKRLGITFQQYQKYERGDNRVSVAKLFRLADILDVPLGFFFDGLELGGIGTSPGRADAPLPPPMILSRRELDLLRAWKAAPSAVADEVAGLLRSVEAARCPPVEAPTASEEHLAAGPDDGAIRPLTDVVQPRSSAATVSPPARPRGRPKGAKNRQAKAPVGGNTVWSPRDIHH
jgi:transcriptional regulator with XRE-family HTH domain